MNDVLKSESLAQLYNRLAIGKVMIGIVAGETGDPRQKDALAYYRAQLRNIQDEIDLREANGETVEMEISPEGSQPEGVVIQLKSARLFGQGGKA